MTKIVKKKKGFKHLFQIIGPGFVTGASDDDPSGIGTYAQTGAQFGYTQLWTAPFSFPFMTIIQEMCGRIGMVTGQGLAGVIRLHYARPVLYTAVLLLFFANVINIGADLGAMAASATMLIPSIPNIVWLLVTTFISILLQIFVPYPSYARFLKYMALSLFAYIITAFVVHLKWTTVLHATFIPTFSFNKEYLMNIVAILGTTISPYLFFWQANEEVEVELEENKIEAIGDKPKIKKSDIDDMCIDTTVGMFFSNLVMYFIIITVAATLGAKGIHNIQTATQAAEALRPIAGNFAFLLFTAGIVGTGLLAVPVLAGSASYAIAETFNWNEGLSKKFTEAKGFYTIIGIATVIGFLINFTSIPPFRMLYYTAILNGVCAPPLMVLIMFISNNKKIMGKYTNRPISNIGGWMITVIMTLAAIAMFATFGQT